MCRLLVCVQATCLSAGYLFVCRLLVFLQATCLCAGYLFVCRLLVFQLKVRQAPEQVQLNVTLPRGKSYWKQQRREQIVTTKMS